MKKMEIPKRVHGVENTIDIQLNQSNILVYVMILLASWLSVLLLFLIYNTADLQMARSEVNLSKNQVQLLGAKLSSLKSQVSHLMLLKHNAEHRALEDNEPEELQGNLFKGIARFSNSNRKRRSPTEDLLSDMQEPLQRRTKISSSTSLKRGLQAVQLKGAYPEKVSETGQVGPWFVDTKALKDKKISSTFQLKENGESIEIGDAGVYFIYAQLYYLTSQAFNSFSIMLVPKESDSQVTLALCSGNSPSSNSTAEVSCFTGVIYALQPGDLIFVRQREKHRILLAKSGHSVFGVIKLSGC